MYIHVGRAYLDVLEGQTGASDERKGGIFTLL